MVVMASLLVRDLEKFKLQRESFQRELKSVRIIEIFELQRFELRKGNSKSFLRKFHGDFKICSNYGDIRITEIRIRESQLYYQNDLDQLDCRIFQSFSPEVINGCLQRKEKIILGMSDHTQNH